MYIVTEFFLTIASYQFFKKDWIFINPDLYFTENILYNSTVSNFKSKVFYDWNG